MATIPFAQNKILSYDVYGDDSAIKSLVLLHGIMGSKKNLKNFADRLRHEHPSFAVVVFDLPNHGESSKGWSPFDIYSVAEIIANGCMNVASVETIVGHSFGGKVAL